MVVLWCYLSVLMIVSRYSLRLRGGLLLVMVDLLKTCNLKLSFIKSDQKYLLHFSDHNSLGLRGGWCVEKNGGVWLHFGNLFLLTRVPFWGRTEEFLLIFSPEYPLGGERGNFLIRVSFQGRTGDISISDFLFNGARMRTCFVHGHWLFIFSQWRTTWFCKKEILQT